MHLIAASMQRCITQLGTKVAIAARPRTRSSVDAMVARAPGGGIGIRMVGRTPGFWPEAHHRPRNCGTMPPSPQSLLQTHWAGFRRRRSGLTSFESERVSNRAGTGIALAGPLWLRVWTKPTGTPL